VGKKLEVRMIKKGCLHVLRQQATFFFSSSNAPSRYVGLVNAKALSTIAVIGVHRSKNY
jgi:hypothetical protein